jgi:hypothetical protein
MDLGGGPARQLEGGGGQGDEGRRLGGPEHRQRPCPLKGPAAPGTGDLGRPTDSLGSPARQGRDIPAGVQRLAYVGNHPLAAGLVLGLSDPGGVQQHPVVVGELRVGPVELRVVEVGLQHPVLQVVEHDALRQPSEERRRRNVGGHPLGLVHDKGRPHEEVPAGRQHDHERPQGAPAARFGVEPHPEAAVVHLTLLCGAREYAASSPTQCHLGWSPRCDRLTEST